MKNKKVTEEFIEKWTEKFWWADLLKDLPDYREKIRKGLIIMLKEAGVKISKVKQKWV